MSFKTSVGVTTCTFCYKKKRKGLYFFDIFCLALKQTQQFWNWFTLFLYQRIRRCTVEMRFQLNSFQGKLANPCSGLHLTRASSDSMGIIFSFNREFFWHQSFQRFAHKIIFLILPIFWAFRNGIPYLQCVSPYFLFLLFLQISENKTVALFLRLERVVISVRCRYPEFMLIQWRYQDMSRYLFNLLNGSPGWSLI